MLSPSPSDGEGPGCCLLLQMHSQAKCKPSPRGAPNRYPCRVGRRLARAKSASSPRRIQARQERPNATPAEWGEGGPGTRAVPEHAKSAQTLPLPSGAKAGLVKSFRLFSLFSLFGPYYSRCTATAEWGEGGPGRRAVPEHSRSAQTLPLPREAKAVPGQRSSQPA